MSRASQLQQAQLASQIWTTWADISINRAPVMSIMNFFSFLSSKREKEKNGKNVRGREHSK